MFAEFAKKHDMELELLPQQSFYPDLTFVSRKIGTKYAVDIKSIYRKSDTKVR
jgi:hypothetical protein